MCTGENSAHQEFGSQEWHHIVGQVALGENGTGESEASQFLKPTFTSKHFVQFHWENVHFGIC